ncbi:MAG: helix-turn-helix transcriptional regulator [Lachnospiraceae bacterium]|nr:helix-turn-helix transcriptional regulator [Lachnospiraceae bacterium]
MTLGAKIKYIREKRNMTQDQLAAKSDIHPVTIRRYETDVRIPKREQLLRICSALNIQMNDLTAPDFLQPLPESEESVQSNVLSTLFTMYKYRLLKIITFDTEPTRFIINPAVEKYFSITTKFSNPEIDPPHLTSFKISPEIEKDLLKLTKAYDRIQYLTIQHNHNTVEPFNTAAPYSLELEESILDFVILKSDLGI